MYRISESIKTGCQGLCELGPLVRIEPQHLQYVHVQVEDCKEIVEKTVLKGEPVDRLFYKHDEEVAGSRRIFRF